MKKINYHIVRTTDTIQKIANEYNLSVTEIKNMNEHISDWVHLIPGTKIRLPAIPEALQDELDDIEPFIEEYYPRINPIFNKKFNELDSNNDSSSTINQNINNENNKIEEKPINNDELPNIIEENQIPVIENNPPVINNPIYYVPYYPYYQPRVKKVIRERS